MPRGQYDRQAAAAARATRNVSLEAEMSDDPENFETEAPFKDADMTSRPDAIGTERARTPIIRDDEPVEIVAEAPTPVSAPAVPAPDPLPAIDMTSANALAAVLAPLLQQMQAGTLEGQKALIDGFQQAMQQQAKSTVEIAKRARIPENQFYPAISVFNPFGDRDFPRPELEGRVYLAQQRRAEEIAYGERPMERMHLWEGGESGGMTYFEILLVNALPEISGKPFKLVDGYTMDGKITADVRIVRGAGGRSEEKLIVVMPFGLISKANHMNKNNFPGPLSLSRQLLGEATARKIIADEIVRITPKLREVYEAKADAIIASALESINLTYEEGRLVAA